MHTPKVIDNFVGKYRFLSNFYASPIMHDKILYPSNEHFYQAMKTTDIDKRFQCSIIDTPGEAKKFGRSLNLRKGWDKPDENGVILKDKIMWFGLKKKFKLKPLRVSLLNTGDIKLVEGNWWGDDYWGVCKGAGKNKLGKMLMKLRKELQNE